MTFFSPKPFAALLGALLLAGCSGLATLTDVATPSDLYTLTPKSTFDSSLPTIRQQIVVEEPTATAEINTDRIIIRPTPFLVQYLPDVRWVDRAPAIVQARLIESYESTRKVGAVGRSAVALRAEYLILTDLRDFHVSVVNPEEPETSPLLVHVRMNMKIVDAARDRIIASRSFEGFAPSADANIDNIVVAFDKALGDGMGELVEWSIRKISRQPVRDGF